MTGTDSHHPPPSSADDGGVRVVSKARTGRGALLAAGLATAAVLGVGVWWWLQAGSPKVTATVVEPRPTTVAPTPGPAPVARRASPAPGPVHVEDLHEDPYELPSLDPTDIATYIRPGDPEPTAAELIEALNHAGIHTGLGAFNPPGTRPALEGLAVPDDYDVPEGYVRHYQSTDEGEPIDPILMFSPDYVFFDSLGEPIVLPDDLVVTEELAPPDLPVRRVRIPGQ